VSLPNPSMAFIPFAILTADEMNDLVENDQALAAGTGLNNDAVPGSRLDITTLLPRIVLARASTGAASTAAATTTPINIPSLSLSAAMNGTHEIEIALSIPIGTGTVPNDIIEYQLKDGGTVIARGRSVVISGTGEIPSVALLWLGVPTAATHNYTVDYVRFAGSGNLRPVFSTSGQGVITIKRTR